MTQATITQKRWGYSLTGGTDATPVTTGIAQTIRMVCSATASADTVTLADASGTTLAKPAAPASLVTSTDLGGVRSDGLTVTLSATGSICNIFLA